MKIETELKRRFYSLSALEMKNVKYAVLEQCGITPQTFHNWLTGFSKPNKLAMEKIAEIMQLETSVLFPENHNQTELL